MPVWLQVLAVAVTPGGTGADALISYVLGFGPLGVGVVLYTLRVIVPAKAADKAAEQARETARADLVRENDRLIAEKTKAEEQRDAALKIAQEQIVPLLTSFVATSQSLIPLLQELVRRKELRRASQRR